MTAWLTSTRAACERSGTACSATTRCGCCACRGWRPSSSSRSSRGRRRWPCAMPRSRRRPPASGSSRSCTGSWPCATRSTRCSLCDELGVLRTVLPEVDALHGVDQSGVPPPRRLRPHAARHRRHRRRDRERRPLLPGPVVAAAHRERRWRRRSTARWTSAPACAGAALLHDIAKPYTRTVLPDGGGQVLRARRDAASRWRVRHPRPPQRQRRAARAVRRCSSGTT